MKILLDCKDNNKKTASLLKKQFDKIKRFSFIFKFSPNKAFS